MELCYNTLEDYLLKSNSNIKNITFKIMSDRMNIFISIVKALRFLHQDAKIIHRDMKPSNLFISSNLSIKIGDFGIAKEIRPIQKAFSKGRLSYFEQSEESLCLTSNIGTPEYIAPEQRYSSTYNEKVTP